MFIFVKQRITVFIFFLFLIKYILCFKTVIDQNNETFNLIYQNQTGVLHGNCLHFPVVNILVMHCVEDLFDQKNWLTIDYLMFFFFDDIQMQVSSFACDPSMLLVGSWLFEVKHLGCPLPVLRITTTTSVVAPSLVGLVSS